MGAIWLRGKYKALDWRDGIDKIQQMDEDYYGHQKS